MQRLSLLLPTLLLFAACTTTLPQQPSPSASQPASQPASPATAPPTPPTTTSPIATVPAGFPSRDYAAAAQRGVQVYDIDPNNSRILLKVWRAGRLAKLGHNHVIIARLHGVCGIQDQGQLLESVQLDAYTAPAEWQIDDAVERAAAGPNFSTTPSAGDIAGTRKNLLGAALLDADAHPFVLISGTGVRADPVQQAKAGAWLFKLQLTTAGHLSSWPLVINATPIEAAAKDKVANNKVDGNPQAELPPAWRGTGALTLSQRAMGLTPFSVLGGALQVRDDIAVEVTVTLQPRP